MSKKFFLKKSYADAVKGFEENQHELEEEHVYGGSVIKPQHTGYKYSRIEGIETTPPPASPQKRRKLCIKSSSTVISNKKRILTTVDSPIIIRDTSSEDGSPVKKHKHDKRNLMVIDSSDYESSPIKSRIPYACEFSDSDDLPSPGVGDDETSTHKADTHEYELDSAFKDCYENDPLLPIYKKLSYGIKTKEAIKVIARNLPEKNIARNVPLGINKNVSFVYSEKEIGHWKNSLCDNMGRWNQMGTETIFFNEHVDGEIDIIGNKNISPLSKKCVRRKYQNASYLPLHRVVITIQNDTDDNSSINDLFFVQYYFDGEEKDIIVSPHGNQKHEEYPYHRTRETVKKRIKECVANDGKPKDVFHTIIEEQGGIEKVQNGNFLPRNRQQIKNIKHLNKPQKTDPLVECADLSKRDSSFLKSVTAAPEFSVFMCTDRQLSDIEKFCTSNKNFSVLGIDTTFNIGNYFVTILTYRHLMLNTAQHAEPVMIGPILLHQKKSFDSYFKMPSSLLQMCPNLVNLKVFGTDGDQNLYNAFQVCFPGSHHLLCDLHMVDNIERKLCNLGIRGNIAKLYKNDIFGSVYDGKKVKGLIDCLSKQEFDEKCNVLEEQWTARHPAGKEFFNYFIDYKAEIIKQTMTAELQSICGFGYPPRPYNQNANECINSVIKRDIAYEKDKKNAKLDPFDFVKIAEKCVRRQENEVKLALIGKGEYSLKKEYQEMRVEEEIYWKKSETQRRSIFKRFQEEPLREVPDQLDHAYKDKDTYTLPVSPEQSQITNVPYRILVDIFNIAAELKENVADMPACKDKNLFIVGNTQNPLNPLIIKYTQSAMAIACESKCSRYNSFKLCEHSVAVANHIGCLQAYLTKYRQKEKECNLTELSNTCMPKGRGKKPTASTQRRKGMQNKKKCVPDDYLDENLNESPNCHTSNQQQEKSIDRNMSATKPNLPDPQPGSYTLALLQFCNQNVAKCYGCGGMFRLNNEEPNPPKDMVIVSKMRRKYFNKDGIEKDSPITNVYFHFNEHCMKSKDNYFIASLIHCPRDLKPFLNDLHLKRLESVQIHI